MTADEGKGRRLKVRTALTAVLAAALRVTEGSYPAACLPAVGKELAAAIQRGNFRNVLKVE